MKTDNVERFLKSVADQVVKQSKGLLKKEKGETALGQTIRATVTADSQGFTTNFYMDDYGAYLDEGVSGNRTRRSFQDYKGESRQSRFAYTTKGPPIDILSKWIKKKGIKPKGFGRGRDKDTGRYISGLAIYISHKIKTRGIKSLSFFQIPLGVGYKRIKEDMLEELKMDIQSYLVSFTKNNK
jgi:hypothetical protein